VVFLDALDTKSTFSPKAVKALGSLYAFDSSENAEIRNRFYRIALRSGPEYAKAAAGESRLVRSTCDAERPGWVVNKGRMKFCRPTYRGIFNQDPELAKKTFMKHKDFYVSISSLASRCILIVDSTQLLER
jgi:leukotriene-A4 hydrolase